MCRRESRRLTLIPRLMVHTRSGMTDATVTLAPKRAKVSVMQVVSISSLPSPMGTRTRLAVILRIDVDREAEKRGATKACDLRVPASAKAIRLERDSRMRTIIGDDLLQYHFNRSRRGLKRSRERSFLVGFASSSTFSKDTVASLCHTVCYLVRRSSPREFSSKRRNKTHTGTL